MRRARTMKDIGKNAFKANEPRHSNPFAGWRAENAAKWEAGWCEAMREAS